MRTESEGEGQPDDKRPTHPQTQQQIPIPRPMDQIQTAQPVGEKSKEQPLINQESQQARIHQGIERLIMRTIRRRIARLIVGQLGRIKSVVSHIHRLRPIADERPDQMERIGATIRELDRLVREHQPERTLPDQHSNLPGSGFRLKDMPQPSDIRRLPEKFQRPARDIQQNQKNQNG